MRIVGILAGGLGTRISEETYDKPKPMVKINDYPILGHLINSLKLQGVEKFYIATGYKGEVIESWIIDSGLSGYVEAINTGISSMTGFRVKSLLECSGAARMMVTYGDGLANVNLSKLFQFHSNHGRPATITVVHPPARFGHVEMLGDRVISFNEKPQSAEGWINGGYFVLEKQVQNYILDDALPFESDALPKLANANSLMAYKHEGFWKPMDTLRDKLELETLAKQDPVPWLL